MVDPKHCGRALAEAPDLLLAEAKADVVHSGDPILLELADLCNRVGVIEQGELKFNGTMQDILDRARTGAVLHVAVAQRAAARRVAFVVRGPTGFLAVSV